MRGRRFWALAGRLDALDLLLVVFLEFCAVGVARAGFGAIWG
jgi:hypothetical protein